MNSGAPIRILPDTWVLTHLEDAPPLGGIFVNSAVITAEEPVVIDTGASINRAGWIDQLGIVLDPADVRWIFITHDDADHIGNLSVLLQLCPQATVLTTWLAAGRMALQRGMVLPMERIRFINDGDTVDVGDRVLRAVLPPVFDNPTTRGVFDPITGFYWGADCFASPVSEFVMEADDISAVQWREGFLGMQRMLSPWHTLLDHRRYAAVIDRVQRLPITAAAGAHGPVVRNSRLPDAFRMLRELPHSGAVKPFNQAEMGSLLAATPTGALPDRRPQQSPYPTGAHVIRRPMLR